MSALLGAKWVIRRYQPSLFSAAQSLSPKGLSETTYDEWRDVCIAADTILGDNCLQMGVVPDVPVVFTQGDDVILIYMKLEF